MGSLGEHGTENGIKTRQKSPSLPAKVQVGFDIEKDGFKVRTEKLVVVKVTDCSLNGKCKAYWEGVVLIGWSLCF